MGWGFSSVLPLPAWQARDPEYDPWYQTKNKNKNVQFIRKSVSFLLRTAISSPKASVAVVWVCSTGMERQ